MVRAADKLDSSDSMDDSASSVRLDEYEYEYEGPPLTLLVYKIDSGRTHMSVTIPIHPDKPNDSRQRICLKRIR